MTKGEKFEACAYAMRELEAAESTVDRMIALHGVAARYQWSLQGPIADDGHAVDFQVRLGLGEVKQILASNRRWVASKLRGLLGDTDPQRWSRTRLVGERRPWWRRIFG